MLADVVEMPGPALLAVHLKPHEDPRLPALLSRGASVSQGVGQPLKLYSILVLTYLSVCSRSTSPCKTSLAPAAHEEARLTVRVHFMAPLMLARLLGRMFLPPLSSDRLISDNTYSRERYLHLADYLVQVFLALFLVHIRNISR